MFHDVNLNLLAVLTQLLTHFLGADLPVSKVKVSTNEFESEYDYIVVGAGSSGAVVAARLSELKHDKVLLLEAGESENLLTEIPLFNHQWAKSPIDWAYETVPQKNACYGMKGRRSVWTKGKLLGGTSSIGYMLYTRGNRRDYDRWAFEEGAKGWSYREVLPYFLKSEDQKDHDFIGAGYHSTGGPQTVTSPVFNSDMSAVFPDAGVDMGYTNRDLNGPIASGFVNPQGTQRNGSRCSTARAFLEPASKRSNLDILTGSQVTRVIFSEKKRAIGVEFTKDKMKRVVFARKDIILSAGSIGTPQLLMLSGIGPKEELKKFGIPLVKELPGVGQNLQDHMFTGIFFKVNGPPQLLATYLKPENFIEYFTKGTGQFTSKALCDGLAFMKSKYANQTDDWPDIEVQLLTNTPQATVAPYQGVTDVVRRQVFEPYALSRSFIFLPQVLRPRSRGYLKLRSADPFDKPIINPRYLSDEHDLRVLLEAMKLAIAIGHTPAYQKLGATLFKTLMPGCEQYLEWSNDYLACVARTFSGTDFHPVGTCRMGPAHDPRSVVDTHLRVIGVTGLRVIDASVMPTLVSAHTNAAAIMIGEKGADLIKGFRMKPVDHLSKATGLRADFKQQERIKNRVMKKLVGRDANKKLPSSLKSFGMPKGMLDELEDDLD